MHRTLKKNSGAEFKEFFEKLHHILKESIRLWAKHGEDGTLVPESEIQKLQNQILSGRLHARR